MSITLNHSSIVRELNKMVCSEHHETVKAETTDNGVKIESCCSDMQKKSEAKMDQLCRKQIDDSVKKLFKKI